MVGLELAGKHEALPPWLQIALDDLQRAGQACLQGSSAVWRARAGARMLAGRAHRQHPSAQGNTAAPAGRACKGKKGARVDVDAVLYCRGRRRAKGRGRRMAIAMAMARRLAGWLAVAVKLAAPQRSAYLPTCPCAGAGASAGAELSKGGRRRATNCAVH